MLPGWSNPGCVRFNDIQHIQDILTDRLSFGPRNKMRTVLPDLFPPRKHLHQFHPVMYFFGIGRPEHVGNEPPDK